MTSTLHELEKRIRPNLRNAVVFGLLALAALVAGHQLARGHPHLDGYRLGSWGCALGVLVFGVLATRSTSGELARIAALRAGTATTTPLRLLVQVLGYLITLLALFDVLDIDLSQFLVGGALTGVVLGIAAQQSLGNFFAGLVLMFARPYVPGDHVTVYSGAINGPHSGTVTDVALLYTTVHTAYGPLHLPNSVLLASAVSPGNPPPPAVGPAAGAAAAAAAAATGAAAETGAAGAGVVPPAGPDDPQST